jgi:hypothetical protein
MSPRTILPVAAALWCVACGHSAASVKSARSSTYDAPFATVWNVVMTEVRKKYTTIAIEDPIRGEVMTAWIRIENRDTEVSDPTSGAKTAVGATRGTTGIGNSSLYNTPGMLFRLKVFVKGGNKGAGPFRVIVDGEAADHRPGLANEGIVLIPHGAADEPPWVNTRIDNIQVAVHERLREHVVKRDIPKEDIAAKVMDDLPWSKLNDPAAVKVVDDVHAAAARRDAPALRPMMADDFRWGLGADGSAEMAIALWSADTTKLRELARALEEGCATEEATGEVVCPAGGVAKSPSMARFRKVGCEWKFVLFLAR